MDIIIVLLCNSLLIYQFTCMQLFTLYRINELQKYKLEYDKACNLDVCLWQIRRCVCIFKNMDALSCHDGNNSLCDFYTKLFMKEKHVLR